MADQTRAAPAPVAAGRASLGQLALLALAGGVTLAPLYYVQPLLESVGQTFAASPATVALVPAATQGGYALGMIIFVPLGDRFDRRPLILLLTAALTGALVAAGLARDLPMLIAASAAVGATATVTQQIVPLAARLASDVERGRVLGRVVAGLLTGIALAWALSGAISGAFGWRAVFLSAAASCLIVLLALAAGLPSSPPPTRVKVAELYRSLPRIWVGHRVLRRASVVHALVFGAYGLFWANVVHLLRAPAIGLGPTSAGLFGLTGVGAAGATLLAGRLADRGDAHRSVFAGIVLTLAALVLSGLAPDRLVALALAGALLGLGMPLSLVPNQARVYALDPKAGGRLNTLFVASQFVAAALGAWAGAQAAARAGWPLAAALGAAAALVALAVELSGRSATPRNLERGPFRSAVTGKDR